MENAGQKRGTTLGTHIYRAPNWSAAGCCGTHAGSDAQGEQWAAGPLREAPVLPRRGCSETEKCGHTASIPTPRPKRLRSRRVARTPWSCTQARVPVNCRVWEQLGLVPGAWRAKIAEKKNRDPPHPDRSNARPARCWSLCDGRRERRTEGHLQPLAGPCGRSEATERRCRMAAMHGAGHDPMAVHVGSSAARSHELIQFIKGSSRQRRGRSRVWIREAKVWGRRYGRGMESEV